MNNIVKDSFVVVSDFHASRWPFDKVKNHYINEYDKIFILGDATDRGEDGIGTGGIKLLFDIKELVEKYPDRVFYLPGNHDDLVYDLVMNNSESAEFTMKYNGGEQTYEDIKYLRRTNSKKIIELAEWLGEQPLQRIHEYKGKKYALAHALFNKNIYDHDKNFALKDFTRTEKFIDEYNIIWFRKGEDIYNASALPSDEYIMVIGHTPEHVRKGQNLNLLNGNKETIKVVCVDGGVSFQGRMLKYDGNLTEMHTEIATHNDTSPKYHIPVKIFNKDKETNDRLLQIHKEQIKEIIIEGLKANSSIYGIANALLYGNVDGLPYSISLRRKAKLIAEQSINEIIEEIAIEHPEYLEDNMNSDVLIHNYIHEIALNHIIDSLIEHYTNKGIINSINHSCSQLEGYIEENDTSYITRQEGNARNVANNIIINGIKKVIRYNGCTSIEEYVKKYTDTKQKRI